MTTRAAYYRWDMVAGDDEARVFTIYSTYDRDSGVGTPVDLTGCTAVVQGRDGTGAAGIAWTGTAVLGDAAGTITVTIPKASTLAAAGKTGTWEVQVTWSDTTEWAPVLGDFEVTPIAVLP